MDVYSEMIKTYMTTKEVFATDNDPFMGVTVCQIANTNKNIYNETLNSITRIKKLKIN